MKEPLLIIAELATPKAAHVIVPGVIEFYSLKSRLRKTIELLEGWIPSISSITLGCAHDFYFTQGQQYTSYFIIFRDFKAFSFTAT